MAITHAAVTLKASASLNAATSVDGTEWDKTGVLGGLLNARVTNGADDPDVGCDVYIYTGTVTTEKRLLCKLTAATGNNVVSDFSVAIPDAAMFVNITFTNSGNQAVTVEAKAQALSSPA